MTDVFLAVSNMHAGKGRRRIEQWDASSQFAIEEQSFRKEREVGQSRQSDAAALLLLLLSGCSLS